MRPIEASIRKSKGLRGMVVDDDSVDTLARWVATAPDYARPHLDSATRIALANGTDPAVVAIGARKAAQNLKALGRVRQGPRLMGQPLPWTEKLTPSGVAPRLFSPQVEKIMGGKASPLRRLLDKPLSSIRPRSELVSVFGHGVAGDVRGIQQWARGDLSLMEMYKTKDLFGAREHLLKQFGQMSTDLRNLDGDALTMMTLNDLTLDEGYRGLTGLAKKDLGGRNPQNFLLDGWNAGVEQVAALRKAGVGEEEIGRLNILPQELLRPVSPRQMSRRWPASGRTVGLHLGREGAGQGGQCQDFARFVPEWEYHKTLTKRDTARKLVKIDPGRWFEVYGKQGDNVRYAAEGLIVKDIENSLIMMSTPEALQRTSSLMNQGIGAIRFLNRLWASSALSLVRGPTYLTTNVIGGIAAGIQAGVNPVIATRNLPRVWRLNMQHRNALKLMERTKDIKSYTREAGAKNLGEFWKAKEITSPEEATRWLTEATADGTLNGGQAQRFKEHIDIFGLGGDDASAYTAALSHLGVGQADIRTLYGAGQYGILQGGRSRDILYEGLQVKHAPPDISPTELAAVERRNRNIEVQKKAVNTVNLGLQEVSIFSEDMLRLGTFMASEATGASWDDAAETVFRSQFDYNDLTVLEHKFKSNVARFYTYPRKLTGLMAETMMSHPGRITATTRIMGESTRYIAGMSFEDEGWVDFLLPDWVEKQPGVFTVAGYAGRLRLPVYEYLELMGTVARLPEFGDGEDIFSGDELPHAQAAQGVAQQIMGYTSGFLPETGKP